MLTYTTTTTSSYTLPCLTELRNKLNLDYDALLNNRFLSEYEFDKAMLRWVSKNRKLEQMENLACSL